jgi:competence protein ComEA
MLRFITTVIFALASLAAHASVDANKASQADLETLRGVGPSLSAKIVEARKAGEFRHWNDLVDRVQGVGPASAAKLSQAGLTVSGTSYDGTPAASKARPARDGARASDGKPADARAERSARADKTAGAEKTR